MEHLEFRHAFEGTLTSRPSVAVLDSPRQMLASDLQLDFSISSLPRRNR